MAAASRDLAAGRFGLSSQVYWTALIDILHDADKEKAGCAMQAMLKMGKLDVPALQNAYEGK
jgi:predicted 3-demethylubiquinone-9 3-methyltransferase (glyoxalase superfamily)